MRNVSIGLRERLDGFPWNLQRQSMRRWTHCSVRPPTTLLQLITTRWGDAADTVELKSAAETDRTKSSGCASNGGFQPLSRIGLDAPLDRTPNAVRAGCNRLLLVTGCGAERLSLRYTADLIGAVLSFCSSAGTIPGCASAWTPVMGEGRGCSARGASARVT